MHLVSRLISITLLAFALFPVSVRAQFQLDVTGARLIPTGKGTSLSDGVWGAGATFRYFTSPNLAIGLNTRYFTRRDSYQFANTLSTNRGSALAATGQVEYFFTTTSALQPYIGGEIGLYHSWYRTEYTLNGTTSAFRSNDSNLMLGPKAGLHYAITPALGLSLDASYQFIIDRGYTGHGLFVNAGVFAKFGRR